MDFRDYRIDQARQRVARMEADLRAETGQLREQLNGAWQVMVERDLALAPVARREYPPVGKYDGLCSESCRCSEGIDMVAELAWLFPERRAAASVTGAARKVRVRLARQPQRRKVAVAA